MTPEQAYELVDRKHPRLIYVSDKKWREIDRFDFDREYFWDRDESHYMRYRVDRVVEIKE